jgi:hypothetical protein
MSKLSRRQSPPLEEVEARDLAQQSSASAATDPALESGSDSAAEAEAVLLPAEPATFTVPSLALRAQRLIPLASIMRAIPPHALLLAGIPRELAASWLPEEFAALLACWSSEEIAAAAQAQEAWLETQRMQDPRISAHSPAITPEELRAALRVMRSLFNWYMHPEITLAGAMSWAGLLLDVEAAAQERGERSPLPLPPFWLSRDELTRLFAWQEAGRKAIAPGGAEGHEDEEDPAS